MSTDNQIKLYSGKISLYMDNYLSGIDGIDPFLLEAIKYSVRSGGKRLRPIILILFYELCKGSSESIYNMACAVEMIHTYSLIHDDLPCMDDDTIRRGKKCTHLVFGEDIALLAGDALITQAFEIMCTDSNIKNIGEKAIISSIKVLSRAAGSCGMVSGQVLDLKMENCSNISEDSIIDMYRNKTGQLFSAAAQVGAICAGASKEYLLLSKKYGENLGIAFQINDDIIDMSEDYKDNNKKVTYVSIFGKDKACRKVDEFTKQAVKCLSKFDGDTSFLIYITNLLSSRIL